MEKEFVPYNLSLRMKQLGFDEPCFGLWNLNNGKYEVDIIGVCKYSKEFKYREVLAPLYQQAFRWFREKYNLNRSIITNGLGEWDYTLDGFNYAGRIWDIYEEAELACLEKLIEIVEQSKSE